MNNIISKFLLAEKKFMSEMHLRLLGFTYNARGLFIRNKTRIQNLKETEDSWYIYRNELDKTCFQHDIAYKDSTELQRRTTYNKGLRDKGFKIASNLHCHGYQRWLTSIVYKVFDKKAGDIQGMKLDFWESRIDQWITQAHH